VYYVSGILRKVKCEKCGNSFDLEREKLLRYYTEEVISRILTKPDRLTEEVKRNFNQFVLSLPFRLLSKPYRVAKEIHEIFRK